MKKDYETIYKQAYQAGMKAGLECLPTPMVVQQHKNMADDSSPVIKSWYVADGLCGFAWVVVLGNNGFVRWLKSQKLAYKGYKRGYHIWCNEFNQSIARKEAWARAFAKVLKDHGIEAYADSRLD